MFELKASEVNTVFRSHHQTIYIFSLAFHDKLDNFGSLIPKRSNNDFFLRLLRIGHNLAISQSQYCFVSDKRAQKVKELQKFASSGEFIISSRATKTGQFKSTWRQDCHFIFVTRLLVSPPFDQYLLKTLSLMSFLKIKISAGILARVKKPLMWFLPLVRCDVPLDGDWKHCFTPSCFCWKLKHMKLQRVESVLNSCTA